MSADTFYYQKTGAPGTYEVRCSAKGFPVIGTVKRTPEGWEHSADPDARFPTKFNTRCDAAAALLNIIWRTEP